MTTNNEREGQVVKVKTEVLDEDVPLKDDIVSPGELADRVKVEETDSPESQSHSPNCTAHKRRRENETIRPNFGPESSKKFKNCHADKNQTLDLSDTELENHYLSNHYEYPCTTTRQSDCKNHYENYKCSYCTFRAISKPELKSHQLIHKETKPVFKCKFCPFTITRRKTLEQHLLILHNVVPKENYVIMVPPIDPLINSGDQVEVKCERSSPATESSNIDDGKTSFNIETPLAGSCKEDLSTSYTFCDSKGNRELRCTSKGCPYKTNTLYSLKRHKVSHNNKGCLRCRYCSFSCTSHGVLTLHLLQHIEAQNSASSSVKNETSTDDWFSCTVDECPYKTVSFPNFKRHGFYHERKGPFSCSFCSFSCKSLGYLKLHLKGHSIEQSYIGQASGCSSIKETKFRPERIRWTSDVMKYRGQKKSKYLKYDKKSRQYYYQCPQCPFRNSLGKSLVIHFKKHKSRIGEKCRRCTFRGTAQELKLHTLLHNNGKSPMKRINTRHRSQHKLNILIPKNCKESLRYTPNVDSNANQGQSEDGILAVILKDEPIEINTDYCLLEARHIVEKMRRSNSVHLDTTNSENRLNDSEEDSGDDIKAIIFKEDSCFLIDDFDSSSDDEDDCPELIKSPTFGNVKDQNTSINDEKAPNEPNHKITITITTSERGNHTDFIKTALVAEILKSLEVSKPCQLKRNNQDESETNSKSAESPYNDERERKTAVVDDILKSFDIPNEDEERKSPEDNGETQHLNVDESCVKPVDDSNDDPLANKKVKSHDIDNPLSSKIFTIYEEVEHPCNGNCLSDNDSLQTAVDEGAEMLNFFEGTEEVEQSSRPNDNEINSDSDEINVQKPCENLNNEGLLSNSLRSFNGFNEGEMNKENYCSDEIQIQDTFDGSGPIKAGADQETNNLQPLDSPREEEEIYSSNKENKESDGIDLRESFENRLDGTVLSQKMDILKVFGDPIDGACKTNNQLNEIDVPENGLIFGTLKSAAYQGNHILKPLDDSSKERGIDSSNETNEEPNDVDMQVSFEVHHDNKSVKTIIDQVIDNLMPVGSNEGKGTCRLNESNKEPDHFDDARESFENCGDRSEIIVVNPKMNDLGCPSREECYLPSQESNENCVQTVFEYYRDCGSGKTVVDHETAMLNPLDFSNNEEPLYKSNERHNGSYEIDIQEPFDGGLINAEVNHETNIDAPKSSRNKDINESVVDQETDIINTFGGCSEEENSFGCNKKEELEKVHEQESFEICSANDSVEAAVEQENSILIPFERSNEEEAFRRSNEENQESNRMQIDIQDSFENRKESGLLIGQESDILKSQGNAFNDTKCDDINVQDIFENRHDGETIRHPVVNQETDVLISIDNPDVSKKPISEKSYVVKSRDRFSEVDGLRIKKYDSIQESFENSHDVELVRYLSNQETIALNSIENPGVSVKRAICDESDRSCGRSTKVEEWKTNKSDKIQESFQNCHDVESVKDPVSQESDILKFFENSNKPDESDMGESFKNNFDDGSIKPTIDQETDTFKFPDKSNEEGEPHSSTDNEKFNKSYEMDTKQSYIESCNVRDTVKTVVVTANSFDTIQEETCKPNIDYDHANVNLSLINIQESFNNFYVDNILFSNMTMSRTEAYTSTNDDENTDGDIIRTELAVFDDQKYYHLSNNEVSEKYNNSYWESARGNVVLDFNNDNERIGDPSESRAKKSIEQDKLVAIGVEDFTNNPSSNTLNDTKLEGYRTSTNMYDCDYCDYWTGSLYNLKRHESTKHHGGSGNGVQCPLCYFKTTGDDNFISHLRIHVVKDNDTFRCPFCDIQDTKEEIILSHVKMSHFISVFPAIKYHSDKNSSSEEGKAKESKFYKVITVETVTHNFEQAQTRTGRAIKQYGNRKTQRLNKEKLCENSKLNESQTEDQVIQNTNPIPSIAENPKYLQENLKSPISNKLEYTDQPKDFLQCAYCPARIRNQGLFKVHLKGHASVRGVRCPLCTYRHNKNNVLKHLSCHVIASGSAYRCPLCKAEKRTLENIEDHLKVVHSRIIFQKHDSLCHKKGYCQGLCVFEV